MGTRERMESNEILAILAEMFAVRYGREGRPLTECKAAILGTS